MSSGSSHLSFLLSPLVSYTIERSLSIYRPPFSVGHPPHPSIYLSIYPPVRPSPHPSASVRLSIRPLICLSVSLLASRPFARPPARPSIGIRPFVCLCHSAHLSIHLIQSIHDMLISNGCGTEDIHPAIQLSICHLSFRSSVRPGSHLIHNGEPYAICTAVFSEVWLGLGYGSLMLWR